METNTNCYNCDKPTEKRNERGVPACEKCQALYLSTLKRKRPVTKSAEGGYNPEG